MKYCITGNGPAGITAAQYIRKNDKSGQITVLTDERHPFYYKPRLPAMLAGEMSLDKITLRKPDWYEKEKINVLYETKVLDIDTENRKIILDGNRDMSYDRLLLANGSSPFIPPVEGINKDMSGVSAFRTADDVYEIDEMVNETNHVTMIGGGLLALENGYSLIKRGRKVRVVEIVSRLLPRQLDQDGAEVLQKKLETMGFEFFLGRQAGKVESRDGRVSNLVLDDKQELGTDLLLVCAGVRSNTELAEKAGIKTDRGVVVDEYMRTSAPFVYAAGDTASFRGKPGGLWTTAMKQGEIAGRCMAGDKKEYIPVTETTKLKVTGVDLVSAGEIENKENDAFVYKADGVYRKLFVNSGKPVGCILLGDTSNDKKLVNLINEKTEAVSDFQKIIEPGFSEWDIFE